MKRYTSIFLIIILLLSAAVPVFSSEEAVIAQEITDKVRITGKGVDNISSIPGGKHTYSRKIQKDAEISVNSSAEMGFLYIEYQKLTASYALKDNNTGETCACGSNGFLHELIDFEELFGHTCTSVTMSFPEEGSYICGITAYSAGELPSYVQRWDLPRDSKADIVLFCTHGDDDQLFFAGIMPYYAKERGYSFQVVYFTDHHNQINYRVHEMLDGLWAVGITAYPVFGPFPDSSKASAEYTQEDVNEFVTEQIRRFKPLVAVGHDLNGEYGHIQHRMYAAAVAEAVQYTADPSYFPDSASEYGVWDVPKTYLHLYGENKIIMDWDTPLSSFGGLTAFEVTRDLGFPCHESQYHTKYYDWIHSAGTAQSIPTYNPCLYGLYRSLTGDDVLKNDMFEHLLTREELSVIENSAIEAKYVKFTEMRNRKEAERLAKEEELALAAAEAEAEAKRLEEARLLEEARRLEEEAMKAVEPEIPDFEILPDISEQAPAAHKFSGINIAIYAGCSALIICAVLISLPRKKVKV